MRSVLFCLSLLLLMAPASVAEPSINPADAPAGHYELDPSHASVVARVRHMGLSHYTMRFDRVAASYDYDPAHPDASKISVVIDAQSLDVGDPGIGKRFAREFLGADEHPQITFNSTAIAETDLATGHGSMTGDLTLRGITRPITLTVAYNGTSASLIGGRRMGFSAHGSFKRSDFGSTAWRGPVGDDIDLIIEAEFVHKSP